jgi:hypothetical protein
MRSRSGIHPINDKGRLAVHSGSCERENFLWITTWPRAAQNIKRLVRFLNQPTSPVLLATA